MTPTTNVAAILTVTMLFAVPPLQGQRPMDHDVWDTWKRIEDQQISRDGRWMLYSLTVLDGDAELLVHALASDTEYRIPRGRDARFSYDSRSVAFRIEPEDSIVKNRKRDKVEADRLPKDSLGILNLGSGQITRVARVKRFALPEEGGGWLAYHHHPDPDTSDATPRRRAGRDSSESRRKEDGTTLVLLDLETGADSRYDLVSSFAFAKPGNALAFARTSEDGEHDGVFVVTPGMGDAATVLEGEGYYHQLAFDDQGAQLAFLTNRDDFDADQPAYALYHWRAGSDARRVVHTGATGIPMGWWVSEHGDVRFSKNGSRLLFGTSPRPSPDPADIPEWEKVELDIWHWRDPLLQPMQLERRDEERRRSYTAVVHLDTDRVVQLATPDRPEVQVAADGDGDIAFAASNVPYRMEISWDSPRYYDLHVVDVNTGQDRMLYQGLQGNARLSPGGQHVAWWDGTARAWFATPTAGGDPVNISARVPTRLDNELHDWPFIPGTYGLAGWTENDTHLLVYDKHDIWALDVTGRDAPRSITEGVGRRENLRFRYVRIDPDEDAIPVDQPLLLSSLHLESKTGGVYRDRVRGSAAPEPLVSSAHQYDDILRAEDADVVMYTRESFRDFPDLWTADLAMRDARRVSHANPQQSEYRWGTAELVHWRSLDGRPHDGLLFKPDDFDQDRQYPMMVYFYEKFSNNLHAHRAPFVGGSSINVPFYVSRGYVVFIPDVHYQVGYPGESAVNSVVSGVLSILDDGYVDPARVGVQGHSWGGYQIAYMVTKTNIFAAAEAGAPVSNMTSAYGGIRWSTGMSRMFQYEKTQSRIGGSLWEARARYIENSPLFWADKVETPVLMMHNDEDGAVPWYQGIEFFVALRRLQKPTWLLNYNGEAHGLRQNQNRKDWQVACNSSSITSCRTHHHPCGWNTASPPSPKDGIWVWSWCGRRRPRGTADSRYAPADTGRTGRVGMGSRIRRGLAMFLRP